MNELGVKTEPGLSDKDLVKKAENAAIFMYLGGQISEEEYCARKRLIRLMKERLAE